MNNAPRLPPLLALRAFESAARNLSFTRAADEMSLTQGAVSRQIKILEDHLGVKLFERHTRRIELTTVGFRYFHSIQGALKEIERSTRLAMKDSHQVLTVNVLPTLNSSWLMPRLAYFTESYPNIELRLVTSIRPVDFRFDDVDVAIRVGRVPGGQYLPEQPRIELEMVDDWKGVSAEYLFPDILIPVVSRKLIEQGASITTPQDLLQFKLIHTTTRKFAWTDWLRDRGLSEPQAPNVLEFGHFFMAIRAARDCKGIAIVPRLLVGRFLDEYGLVCPIKSDLESAGAYYMLSRESESHDSALRLFKKWLHAEAAALAEDEKRAWGSARHIRAVA